MELAPLSGKSLVRPDGRLYMLGGGLRVQALDAAGRRLEGFTSRARRTGRFRGLAQPNVIAPSPGGRLLVAGGNVHDRGRIVIAGEAYDDDYGIRDDLGRSYPAVARLKG